MSSRYILLGGNPEGCIMGDYISDLQTWNAREELEDIVGKRKVRTSLHQFLPPPGHEWAKENKKELFPASE